MVKKNFLKSSLVIAAVVTLLISIMPAMSFAASENTPSLTYRAHMQTYSWSNKFATAGEELTEVGKTGESKRMEALEINFEGKGTNAAAKLYYRAHVQGIGWQDWVEADNVIDTKDVGTEGQSLRVEGYQIAVQGLKGYEVTYSAHVQGIGWMDPVVAATVETAPSTLARDEKVAEGTFAGTSGKSLRVEAIRIWVKEDIRQAASTKFGTDLNEEKGLTNVLTDAKVKSADGNVKLIEIREVKEAIDAGKEAILKSENTVEGVANVRKAEEAKVMSAVKTAVKNILKAVYNNGLGSGDTYREDTTKKYMTKADYEATLAKIDASDATYTTIYRAYEEAIASRLTEDQYNTADAKAAALKAIEELYPANDYKGENKTTRDGAVKTAIESIESASDVEGVQTAMDTLAGTMVSVKSETQIASELEEQKKTIKTGLETTYVTPLKANVLGQGHLGQYWDKCVKTKAAYEAALAKIESATTSEESTKFQTEEKAKILVAIREDLQNILDEVCLKAGVDADGKIMTLETYESVSKQLAEADASSGSSTLITEFEKADDSKQLLTQVKADLITKLFGSGKHYGDASYDGSSLAKKATDAKLIDASTKTTEAKALAKELFGEYMKVDVATTRETFIELDSVKNIFAGVETKINSIRTCADLKSYNDKFENDLFTAVKTAVMTVANKLRNYDVNGFDRMDKSTYDKISAFTVEDFDNLFESSGLVDTLKTAVQACEKDS